MPKPIPFPKLSAEAERKLDLEQETVRMIAHAALKQVDAVLAIFNDDDHIGYFVFGAMVAALSIKRCMIGKLDSEENLLERHDKAVRDFLAGIEAERQGMD